MVVFALTASETFTQFANTTPGEFSGQDPGKVNIWLASTDLLWNSYTTGIGRGAFETSFSPYAPSDLFRRFSHVENEYLQMLLDWGIYMGVFLLLLLFRTIYKTMKSPANTPRKIGAKTGLTMLLLHAAADFALSLPSVMVIVIIFAALLKEGKLTRANFKTSHTRRFVLSHWSLFFFLQ